MPPTARPPSARPPAARPSPRRRRSACRRPSQKERAPATTRGASSRLLFCPIMLSRVERVTQRIAQQVEAKHGGTDRNSGEDRSPRSASKLFQISAVCNHRPPAWRRRGNAESEKRQRCFGHDRARYAEGGGGHHPGDHIWQNVLRQDAEISRPPRPDNLDVLELTHDQHLAANDARHSRPTNDSDRREYDAFR